MYIIFTFKVIIYSITHCVFILSSALGFVQFVCIDTSPSSGQILKFSSTSHPHHPQQAYFIYLLLLASVHQPLIDLSTFTPNPIVSMLYILLWFVCNRVKMNESAVSSGFSPAVGAHKLPCPRCRYDRKHLPRKY